MSDLAIASVHDALQEAVINKRRSKREPKENITIRLDPAKKDKLKEICKASGIDPSDFMRACVDRLLVDFMGPKQFAQFEAQIARIEIVD